MEAYTEGSKPMTISQRPEYIFAMRLVFSITLMFVLYCAFTPIPITWSFAEITPILHGPVASVACSIIAAAPFQWPADQAGHFSAFAVLAMQSAMAFPFTKTRVLALCLLALGIGIEIIQAIPVVGRTPELRDILVDIAGISFGFAAVYAIRVLVRMGPRRKVRKPVAR